MKADSATLTTARQRVSASLKRSAGPQAWLLAASLACFTFVGEPKTGRLYAGVISPGIDRSSLVLELLFEGNVMDTSPAKRTCMPRGAITYVEGKHGKCAALDGHSWVDTQLLQKELGPEFTVECWVNPAVEQSVHADIFGNHASEGLGFVVQQDAASTNQFLAAYGTGAGRWVLTPAVPLAPGRWQHVALVKTRDEVRLCVNGVVVAAEQDPAPARPSPMPVAVGLGYTDPGRCFRGRIDEFRIWNKALTTFEHAGIDPAAARETRSLCLDATPRPNPGGVAESWTLATEDTRLTLGVTAAGEPVVRELSCPATGWNWIARAVAFGLPPQVEVAGQPRALTVAIRRRTCRGNGRPQVDAAVCLRGPCHGVPLLLARESGSRPHSSHRAFREPLDPRGDDWGTTHVRSGPDGRGRPMEFP